jgi:MFS family permease
MSSLDVFIVNVGLRSIGKDLGSGSLADLSWILTAYAIVFAALLVPAGRLADRYGVKQAFLFGLAVFTLGSLGCALSTDLWVIVGLRCVSSRGLRWAKASRQGNQVRPTERGRLQTRQRIENEAGRGQHGIPQGRRGK